MIAMLSPIPRISPGAVSKRNGLVLGRIPPSHGLRPRFEGRHRAEGVAICCAAQGNTKVNASRVFAARLALDSQTDRSPKAAARYCFTGHDA